MSRGVDLGLGASRIATISGITAWSFVGYVVLHVLVVLQAGTFWKMFRPRPLHVATAVLALVIAGGIVAATYSTDQVVHPTLRVATVEVPRVLDGDDGNPAGQAAESVEIATARGANLPNGEVDVEVRAVLQADSIYFRFRSADPQRSRKMTPP